MKTDSISKKITIDGKEYKVIAIKDGSNWQASGEFNGETVTGVGAKKAECAFENWEKRAKRSVSWD